MLTFDADRHLYFWNGEVVPGVTRILAPIHDFSKVPQDVLAAAQHRGTYVHRMTELFDLGTLDADALANVEGGRWMGYLRAWRSFVEDHEPNWTEIEQPGYSRLHGYAGTWDRRGVLAAKRPGNWLIDIKTADEQAYAHGVQTAAYRQICTETDASAALDRRASIHLHADGSYDFHEWTQPDDIGCFFALLTLYQWKARRK